jgi:hypothetical protein
METYGAPGSYSGNWRWSARFRLTDPRTSIHAASRLAVTRLGRLQLAVSRDWIMWSTAPSRLPAAGRRAGPGELRREWSSGLPPGRPRFRSRSRFRPRPRPRLRPRLRPRPRPQPSTAAICGDDTGLDLIQPLDPGRASRTLTASVGLITHTRWETHAQGRACIASCHSDGSREASCRTFVVAVRWK